MSSKIAVSYSVGMQSYYIDIPPPPKKKNRTIGWGINVILMQTMLILGRMRKMPFFLGPQWMSALQELRNKDIHKWLELYYVLLLLELQKECLSQAQANWESIRGWEVALVGNLLVACHCTYLSTWAIQPLSVF